MKIFIIGGTHSSLADDRRAGPPGSFASTARRIGAFIAQSHHVLVTCSPFPGSADLDAQVGFAGAFDGDPPPHSAEMHYPDDAGIDATVSSALDATGLRRVTQRFRHPAMTTAAGALDLQQSWLLSQLAALDRGHGVIALGGNVGGTAHLLLHLADARRMPVLPLPFFGGAAEAAYQRRRYELTDRLGLDATSLYDAAVGERAVGLLEGLVNGAFVGRAGGETERFFISYPRARPEEADFVETLLRRRNRDVFRDDHDIEPGEHLPAVIRERIHAATTFIALWGREYACSPWCHDELDLALDRSEGGHLRIVLICVDQTRVVPPRARQLVHYMCNSRSEIEARILGLLIERAVPTD